MSRPPPSSGLLLSLWTSGGETEDPHCCLSDDHYLLWTLSLVCFVYVHLSQFLSRLNNFFILFSKNMSQQTFWLVFTNDDLTPPQILRKRRHCQLQFLITLNKNMGFFCLKWRIIFNDITQDDNKTHPFSGLREQIVAIRFANKFYSNHQSVDERKVQKTLSFSSESEGKKKSK